MVDIMRCIVCGSNNLGIKYPARDHVPWENAAELFMTHRKRSVRGRIVQCRDCGFIFTSPQYTIEQYAKIYNSAIHHGAATYGQIKRLGFLAQLVQAIVPQGQILDVGSSNGCFIDLFEPARIVGTDIQSSHQNVIEGRLPPVGGQPTDLDGKIRRGYGLEFVGAYSGFGRLHGGDAPGFEKRRPPFLHPTR